MDNSKEHINKMKDGYTYKYPHPAVTVDCVVFGINGNSLQILLIRRSCAPYKNSWALPGGFVKIDETIEKAAYRELYEETGHKDIYLDQFKVYSDIDRDPRERVISIAFIGLMCDKDLIAKGGDDACEAKWIDINDAEKLHLAFDHDKILADARKRLREIIKLKPAAFSLLKEIFTISELQRVYELIYDTTFDRRNFQRKLMASNILEERGIASSDKASRPPKLYSLKKKIKVTINGNCNSIDHKFVVDDTFLKINKRQPAYNNKEKKDTSNNGSISDLFSF